MRGYFGCGQRGLRRGVSSLYKLELTLLLHPAYLTYALFMKYPPQFQHVSLATTVLLIYTDPIFILPKSNLTTPRTHWEEILIQGEEAKAQLK